MGCQIVEEQVPAAALQRVVGVDLPERFERLGAQFRIELTGQSILAQPVVIAAHLVIQAKPETRQRKAVDAKAGAKHLVVLLHLLRGGQPVFHAAKEVRLVVFVQQTQLAVDALVVDHHDRKHVLRHGIVVIAELDGIKRGRNAGGIVVFDAQAFKFSLDGLHAPSGIQGSDIITVRKRQIRACAGQDGQAQLGVVVVPVPAHAIDVNLVLRIVVLFDNRVKGIRVRAGDQVPVGHGNAVVRTFRKGRA